MSTDDRFRPKTDDELRQLDVPAMLRYGLEFAGPHRSALFGEGAIAAALASDALGVVPRSTSFLAEVVRSGGARYAADLTEPLPGAEPTRLARDRLTSAATTATTVDGDQLLARWLDAVAEILGLRRDIRSGWNEKSWSSSARSAAPAAMMSAPTLRGRPC
ncbi:hypothetical protein ABZW30_28290 [Kitasatospora sp. NPDC004669]|uniref:hypothetical protein n=1 Tax=Kitasatospora sp. NPDC004669 TaxID=3154555 RepID=UPI0033B588B9